MRGCQIAYGGMNSGAEVALSHMRWQWCTGFVATGALDLMATEFCFDRLDLSDFKNLLSEGGGGFLGQIRIQRQRTFLALIVIKIVDMVHFLDRQKLSMLPLMAILCSGFASGGLRLFSAHLGTIRGRRL